MSYRTNLRQFFVLIALILPLTSQAAALTEKAPVTSVVVFGDSLSDIGNTTHLLKSLKQEEDPAYLVRPLKQFVINKMVDFSDRYHVPQMVLDAGIDSVREFFDQEFAPMLAQITAKIRQMRVIPGRPYWNSRFSNGRVWVEYLLPMLGIEQSGETFYVNQAFSGSWAMTYNRQLTVWNFIRNPTLTLKALVNGKLIPPSLGLTVHAYLMERRSLNQNAVYFIFSGSNDYLNALVFGDTYNPAVMNDYVDNVLNDISASVKHLTQAGARRFVLMGLPHIGSSPKFSNTADEPVINAAIERHNSGLQQRLAQWALDQPSVDFLYIDLQTLFQKGRNNPAEYGFTNVTDACIDVKIPILAFAEPDSPFKDNFVMHYAQSMQAKHYLLAPGERNYHVCDTPDSYMFWDAVHPSTRTHKILANEICDLIKAHGYLVNCSMPS